MNHNVPPDFQAWLDQRALTVVPVAAAELLEGVVEHRIENLALHRLVRDLAADRLGDAATGTLLAGYQARIVELEQIIEKQNRKIARRAS